MADHELNQDYFDAGIDLTALDDWTTEGKSTVLDRLGPAHFRSKGFSFMGFLQTVYDQVAEQTAATLPVPPSPAPPAEDTSGMDTMPSEESDAPPL